MMKMGQHKYVRIQWGILFFSAAFLCAFVITSCKKDTYVNPYDAESLKPPVGGTQSGPVLDGFAWLHEKIFFPTCANSGCHDGNFEPDFRTIYSAYQSLVYQPVISNDSAGSFTYRVLPGNAAKSLIHERLTVFIPNSSGMMPLVTNKDWDANKTLYIQKIKDWINAGAKDMFGNPPSLGNIEPAITGMLVFPFNTTSLPAAGPPPFPVQMGSTVDLWFSVTDDSTLAKNMTVNQIKFSTKPLGFTNINPQNMQIVANPITGKDFQGNSVSFTHKATFNAGSSPVGTIIYVRTYIRDESHGNATENPADGSNEVVRNLYTLKIVP
jgi:hypothetical protein